MKSKVNLVVKDNDLIRAGYRLTLMEQRIVLMAITQLNRAVTVDHVTLYRVTVHDMARALDVASDNLYPALKEAAENLFERKFTIILSDGKPLVSRWVDSSRYLHSEGAVEISFSQTVMPYLTQLKERFTCYDFFDIANLSSMYAVRIYELMMQWKTVGVVEIKVDELREMLELTDRYPRLAEFKRNVIDTSIKQINEHTPYSVTCIANKQGRRINSFTFRFRESQKAVRKSENKKSISNNSEISARARQMREEAIAATTTRG